MATVAEIQAELDGLKALKIQRQIPQAVSATVDLLYVNGGVGYTKKSKWVEVTNTDSAADQSTDIETAMA